MYTFFRSLRLGPGSLQEQMAWSLSMTEKVNQISEATFTLWTPFLSPGVNRLFWVAFVDDLATIEATGDKLMADSGYHMLLEQGARYVSTDAINDVITMVVHAEGIDPARQPAYVAEVTAVAATGAGAKSVEVGIEIAKLATKTTGTPTMFSVAGTGIYGQVAWHTGFDSITDLQRGQTAIAMDAKFTEYLDKSTPGVYQPAATQNVYRRVM